MKYPLSHSSFYLYERLPVFVDGLQEDRRNIKDWEFPKVLYFQ